MIDLVRFILRGHKWSILLILLLGLGTVVTNLAFIWLSDDPMPSDLVHKRMLTLLNRAADRLQMDEAPQSPPQ